MDKMTCQMTVLFEGAFWVGVFEKTKEIAYPLRR